MRVFVVVLLCVCLSTGAAVAQQLPSGKPVPPAGEAALAPPDIAAAGAVLIERGTGRVLFAIAPDRMLPIASITKVMTALIVLEHCDLTEVVTASARASGVPGTSIYLAEGEQLSVNELLLGLLLRSGNDAAIALAEHVAGSVEAFVALMNARAAQLGAQAHFVNPNGLDVRAHGASALGMALIAREALDFPAFRTLVATERATIPWQGNPYERVLTNKNKLLTHYPGATGVKTGFTKKAGRCLIFSAERDGMELVGVLLNCGNWFDAATQLLDWGFATYSVRTFLKSGEVVAQLPVSGGMKGSARVVCPMNFRAPIGQGETVKLLIETEERLLAPVIRGAVVGRASVIVAGEVVAEQWLVVDEPIDTRTYPCALWRTFRAFNPVA
ncbi:MAG: D-alanyl-D-alanine carboxypeptidase family protein [Clostridia bacterium]